MSSLATSTASSLSRFSMAAQAVGAIGACAAAMGDAQAAESAPASTDTSEQAGTDHAPRIEEIVVKGVRPLLGNKLPELQNTPQTVTVVTQQLLEEQGVTRLQDALKNVPGITLNAGEGAARGDTVNIRGFSAFNDFFLDGIRDAAVYTRDSFDIESIEVVKGPSAVLFGRGSTGGAINQVSKAPTLAPFSNLSMEFGSNADYRGTADLDQKIGAATAVRLNAMAETSDVADRDYVKNRRWGVAPSLSTGLNDSTTLTLSYLHQQENDVPDVGIPMIAGEPAQVPRNAYYGLASDRTIAHDDIATAQLKHDFNADLTVSNTLRYAHYTFNYQFDAPNFGSNVPTTSTPLSSILVGRDSPSSSGVQTNLTDQLDVTSHFQTGILKHNLLTGIELGRQVNDLDRYNNPFNANNNWVPETPLLAPNPEEIRPFEPVASTQDTTAYAAAAYAIDTIGIGPHFDLIAGLRFDHFSASYNQVTVASGAVLNLYHADNVASPRAALIYKPTPSQSYYVSFGTSFDPSAEALALTTKTANLGPVKAKSYEAGAKTSWLDDTLLLTGAVFRTVVDNAQTNDPDNPTVTVLNGNERVNGFELGATGHIGPKLEITAGYTYLDGETIASGTAAYVGKFLPNTARNALNWSLEYYITDAWEIGTNENYLGHRFADSGQTANIPGYFVWNAMTSYRINKSVVVQLNGINLSNKLFYDGVYYTSAAENHLIPGPGRTVKLTLRTNF